MKIRMKYIPSFPQSRKPSGVGNPSERKILASGESPRRPDLPTGRQAAGMTK